MLDPNATLENMSIIDTIIQILFPDETEFEKILINAVRHSTNWTNEHKRDLVLHLLRQRLSLHEYRQRNETNLDHLIKYNEELFANCETLRNTNATLMHQNADLTRENKSLLEKLVELESDAINTEVQNKIRNMFLDALGPDFKDDIDGAGTDEGPWEFTLCEISQGIRHLCDQRDTLKSEISNLKLKLDAVWHSADLANDTIKYIAKLIREEKATPVEKYLLTRVSQYIVTWQPSPPDSLHTFAPSHLHTNKAEGTTPPQTTERTNTMSKETIDPTHAPDQELPAPGANAGDTAQDCDKPTGFLGRAANRIGEAIDDVQRTVGLQSDAPQCEMPIDTYKPKPIGESIAEVIASVSKAQEDSGRALNANVTIVQHHFGTTTEIKFTL
ncbi:MAG: hypothetical protein IT366_24410 [Candidatus Hydrogenedentes bacterium]|nr:hypothetical protein [Candidatus Hydrogenedentota bacterium]